MSEEENIDQSTVNARPDAPVGRDNISKPSIINEQPTEIMEVHKHPHHITHKKKWGEYLLEFFMLFLAVFLGFVAENIRENSVERHREKEYISSLLDDLKADTALLNLSIKKLIPYYLELLDSTEHLLTNTNLAGQDKLIYQTFISATAWTYDFHPTERTLSQLRNQGFHLIKNTEAARAISSLEDVYKLYNPVSTLMQNMQNDIDMSAAAFADRTITYQINKIVVNQFPFVKLTIADIPSSAKINYSNKPAIALYLTKLRNYSFLLGTSVKISYDFVLGEIIKAISTLNKEYHLENE